MYQDCCLFSSFFFFNDTATTEIYTLSLHDALPISARVRRPHAWLARERGRSDELPLVRRRLRRRADRARLRRRRRDGARAAALLRVLGSRGHPTHAPASLRRAIS